MLPTKDLLADFEATLNFRLCEFTLAVANFSDTLTPLGVTFILLAIVRDYG